MRRPSVITTLMTWILLFLFWTLVFYLFQEFLFGPFIIFPLKLAFSVVSSAIFSPPWIGIIAQIAPSAIGLDRAPVEPDRWKKFQKGFVLGVIVGAPIYFSLSLLGDIYIFQRNVGFISIHENFLISILFSILCSICIIGIGLIIEVYPGGKEANLEGSD